MFKRVMIVVFRSILNYINSEDILCDMIQHSVVKSLDYFLVIGSLVLIVLLNYDWISHLDFSELDSLIWKKGKVIPTIHSL